MPAYVGTSKGTRVTLNRSLIKWERSVFIPIPKKGNAKKCSDYHTIALISHASKIMLKILQARLQQYMNQELPRCLKLDLEKAEEPEVKLPTSTGSSKKQESSRNTSISALLTMPKLLTVWITINRGKFFKRWETGPPYLTPKKPVCMSGRGGEYWKRSMSRMYIVTLLI